MQIEVAVLIKVSKKKCSFVNLMQFPFFVFLFLNNLDYLIFFRAGGDRSSKWEFRAKKGWMADERVLRWMGEGKEE